MRIRKWDGSAWTPISPKVTYTDVVADVTAGTPTSIFSGGKLLSTYLPEYVFGGMQFVAAIGSQTESAFASNLDTVQQTYGTDNVKGMIGKYFVATGTFTLGMNSLTQAGSTGRYYQWDTEHESEEGGGTGDDLVVEAADWIVIQKASIDGSGNYIIKLSVVNNTYATATASARGILKIEDNTVQTVAANAVSATSGRTYGIQVNSSGQAVVNVPWSDTNTDTNTTYTTSAVDSGSNAIIRLTGSDSSTEDITLVAGSNMTITPSGDNITLASAHPSISAASSVNNSGRTYIQDITVDSNGHITGITSATETVTDTNTVTSVRRDNTGTYRTGNINLVGGSNVTITETSTGVFSFASTDTNDNTTYSAGNGIALSGTTFSVASGVGLTQEASGLKMENPIEIGTSTPHSDYEITNGALWFDLS